MQSVFLVKPSLNLKHSNWFFSIYANILCIYFALFSHVHLFSELSSKCSSCVYDHLYWTCEYVHVTFSLLTNSPVRWMRPWLYIKIYLLNEVKENSFNKCWKINSISVNITNLHKASLMYMQKLNNKILVLSWFHCL